MKSIKTQMLIYLMLGAIAIFSILGFFSYALLQKLPLRIEAQYTEITNARADEVSKELKGFVEQIKIVSQSPIIKSMDLQAVKKYLPSLVLEGKHKNMTFATPEGKAFRTTGEEIDISMQEQYKKIFVEKMEYNISQPFISEYLDPNNPITVISHAVKNEGETVGLVNIVIDVEFLNKIVREINLKKTGYAWIVNQEGLIVAHPDSSVPLKKNIHELIKDNDTAQTILYNEWGTSDYTEENGGKTLIFFKRIKESPGWTFIMSISAKEVHAEVQGIKNTINLVIILGLFLVIVFSVFYSETIASPILKLQEVFEKAANGELNAKADERVPNEVGSAAKSFNKMIEQIKNLTYRDVITDLYNYNGFLLELPYKLQKLKEKGDIIAIVILSVDDFKRVNSIGGYELGNQVLRDLGEQLEGLVEESELVARFLGDEFILLLREEELKALENKIYRIWKKCSGHRISGEHEFTLKNSMGVGVLENPEDAIEETIYQAMVAKVKVKKVGGNNYQFYNFEIDESIKLEHKILHNLHHALENNGLTLVYQPIIELRTTEIVGVEALLRWNSEIYGNTSAQTLIEIAEQNGLINEIGKWVLYEACMQSMKWQKQGYAPIVMAVNASPLQFDQINFVEIVEQILSDTGINPNYLEIEITESNAMDNVEEKLIKMKRLRDMGVRLAIDDFGTGYSSLAYITRFPIDTLKIDRSFINDMIYDDNAKTIITTIITMAKAIGITSTGEGVETLEQLGYLKLQGCNKIQGYLMCKPVQADEIEEWLEKRKKY